MDTINDRDALGRTLHMSCPIGVLLPGTPWGALTEREREAWRVLADVAYRWCGPSPRDVLLTEIRDGQNATLAMMAMMEKVFGPYARHLDACPQTPCTCGFAALPDDMP
jgi:hypothetical protein